MPRGGDDLASTDEVKIYKDEGDDENRASQNLSEDKRELVIETEEGKESDIENGRFLDKASEGRSYLGNSASDYLFSPSRFSFGYPGYPLITPYPYPSSAAAASFGLSGVPPFYMYNNELFGQPPPAHMRLAASFHLPPHPGLPGGPSMYGLSTSAAAMAAAAAAAGSAHSPSSAAAAAAAMYGFPPPGSPHSSHLAAHNPFYTPPELSPWAGSMPFSSPYSPYHQLSRLGSIGSMHPGISYPGVSRPALVTSGPSSSHDPSPPRSISDYISSDRRHHHSSGLFSKRHISTESRQPPSAAATTSSSATNGFSSHHHSSSSSSSMLRHHHNHHRMSSAASVPPPAASASATSPSSLSPSTSSSAATTYRRHGSSSMSSMSMSHVKKPLNAFMLFMKEMRQKVIEECTLKESAAINQILGRKWHSLDRAEQARYYDLARREKELHRKRYPTWSARDNYALHSRKRRKRLDHRPVYRRDGMSEEDADGNNAAKKCRARYGLDQQSQWCKPCRRKKRCIRFVPDGDNENGANSCDEGDNSSTILSSSLPPAADSTTEVFSPMPLSAASSSNTDDIPTMPGGGGSSNSNSGTGHVMRHHESNRTVHDVTMLSRSSFIGGPSRHSIPPVNINSGLISSTIL